MTITRSRTRPSIDITFTPGTYFHFTLPTRFTGFLDTGIAKHNSYYDRIAHRPEFILEFNDGRLVNKEIVKDIETYLKGVAVRYSAYQETLVGDKLILKWTLV